MRVVVGLVVASAAAVLTASPAGASDQPGYSCTTRDATPVYANADFTGYLFTLSGGRGFRAHVVVVDWSGLTKANGHGAENPARDGWVRGQHLSC